MATILIYTSLTMFQNVEINAQKQCFVVMGGQIWQGVLEDSVLYNTPNGKVL